MTVAKTAKQLSPPGNVLQELTLGCCMSFIFRVLVPHCLPLEAKHVTAVPKSGWKNSLIINLSRKHNDFLNVFIQRCSHTKY